MQEYCVCQEDRFIILASDGVWEFISSQEACEIVSECQDPAEAARELIITAWDLWCEEEPRTDDISVIVAFLDSKAMGGPSWKC